jgi:hypothetical protein
VDPWSREVLDLLSRWPMAEGGEWTRWEPGYLLLEIERVGGEEIEPVRIDTAHGELTVEFGGWERHLPPSESGGEDAASAVEEAKALACRWITGRVMTAIYSDLHGRWCGSTLVAPGDMVGQLVGGADWLKEFGPVAVELRRLRRAQWRSFVLRGREAVEQTGT